MGPVTVIPGSVLNGEPAAAMNQFTLAVGFGLVTAPSSRSARSGFTLQFGVTNLFNLAFGE